MTDQQILTVPEAAELARVSRAHMYRLVSEGTIPSVRLGKRVVVPQHEIEAYLRVQEKAVDGSGVWMAYHCDYSGLAVFDTELECLQYAVGKTMSVAHVGWGQDLREATR